MKLFITGFIQVFLVCINTYFIANKFYLGVFICAFLISFVWSFNVTKIAISTLQDRLIYSFGASLGGLIGLIISSNII
jgi:hypothetical protein